MKRRLSPEPFEDELDTENIDPNILCSPSKKSKAIDGMPSRAPKFALIDASKLTITPVNSPFPTTGNVNPKTKLKPLSISVPTSTTTTPIAHSRGSPKHKRVGLLSNKRRFSSSPFRRVDPPRFNSSIPSLPFTIDAALSGTISSHKSYAKPNELEVEAVDTSMPKSWFFAIHVDTPEDEAANLMEHSAATLDISSDDDGAERRRKRDIEERGKENVPPADWTGPVRGVRGNAEVHRGICDEVKREAKMAVVESGLTMVEDRMVLKEMLAKDFYPEGMDEGSVEVVREDVKQKPSGLAKDTTFDFVPESATTMAEELAKVDEEIFVRPDTP